MRLKSPKLIVVLSAIVGITSGNLFFVAPKAPKTSPSFSDPSSCRTCHQAITDSFVRTAHYFDSRPADSSSIKGSFEAGKNKYTYNPFMAVLMIRKENKFLQSG